MQQDTAIVTAVRAGDTEAFRLLVDRHKGRLHGILMRLLGDGALAEELAHEAFVKAYLGIQDFRGEASFGTWLVQIGIHAVRDHLRRQKRLRQRGVISLEELREAHQEVAEPADERRASNPFHCLDDRERDKLMQQGLAELPVEYREVLLLKHFEGWAYEDIAALTGDSVGTLKVRAHRARRLLKEHLSNLGLQFGLKHSHPPDIAATTDEEAGHA
jgi:RNA polymerase sigma-70 factor (ECF subfamily)